MRTWTRFVPPVLAVVLLLGACGRSGSDVGAADDSGSSPPSADAPFEVGGPSAAEVAAKCASEPLTASEVGVTPETITIEVMADTGSPLAPGFFQGDVDAITGYADYINAHGGLGCRQLVVRTWD